jgi:hypothetical protein
LEDTLMYRFTHAHDPLLGPPAHVLAEVDAAWERSQELSSGELELHFALDGRVTGELRLADGSLVERISATEALALACGDAALALPA